MRIAVLVKQVPDTEETRALDLATGRIDRSGAAVPDQINEIALEVALQVKDGEKSTEVIAIGLGPERARDALRTCLAMGADRALHVLDPAAAGADAIATARILAAAVRQVAPDLVLAGNESTDGRSGIVPAAIAELLGWPSLPALESVRIEPDAVSGVLRDGGTETDLRAALPALASVTERAAEARFPTLRGIMGAKRKPMEVASQADLGTAAGDGAASVVVAAQRRPERAAGEKIAAADDAAVRLAEFLTQRHLA